MKKKEFKNSNNKKIKSIVFSICCVFLITGIIFFGSKNGFSTIKENEEENLYFAFYLDNKLSKTIPTKEDGYVFEKGVCDNGATVEFLTNVWAPKVHNLTKSQTKCSLYFNKKSYVYTAIALNLDSTGSCPTTNEDKTVNVTKKEEINGYVCSALDDYGTSYYYQGNVVNNYVKFGGFYWRILRINGDESIRMIYAGDASVIDALDEATKQTVLSNGYDDSTTKYTQIGESKFNESIDDNAYAGYMYGTTSATTYEETHANTNDSSIKKVVDKWYQDHLLHTDYEKYLSDNLFCNDRSIGPALQPYAIDFSFPNTGIGGDTTFYRWFQGPWSADAYKNNPTFSCKQQNDRFTVEDTVIGNGALTYPIGIISTDDIVLAGGYDSDNQGYYLYTGYDYWTMSPQGSGRTRYLSSTGSALAAYRVDDVYGIRPIINLKTDSLNSGTGTWNDPYQIQ